MDSLTQIVLGAAVGEAAKGKTLGNKAMFWGAVGGTIPDLDVLVGAGLKGIGLVDEMWTLAFHRGISHSLFFAFLAPLLLGPLIAWHYKNPRRKYVSYIGSLMIFALIGFAINYVSYEIGGQKINVIVLLGTLALGGYLFSFFYKRFFERELSKVDGTWKDFAWIFFWAIFTHPLLDSCTTFGTQLFLPFSDYRVGFNNIAVADLFYTIPFLACMVGARMYLKNTNWRKILLWAGLGISSAYLLWTVYNKHQVNQVFEKSLHAQGIEYDRYMTSPVLFTNFLWSGTAEAKDTFYQALYSRFDEDALIPKFKAFPKNHHLIEQYKDERPIKILKWFSNDYFAIMVREDSTLQLNDLRFGTFGDNEETTPEDFVFRFILKENEGVLEAHEGERDRGDFSFGELFDRIRGKKFTSKK